MKKFYWAIFAFLGLFTSAAGAVSWSGVYKDFDCPATLQADSACRMNDPTCSVQWNGPPLLFTMRQVRIYEQGAGNQFTPAGFDAYRGDSNDFAFIGRDGTDMSSNTPFNVDWVPIDVPTAALQDRAMGSTVSALPGFAQIFYEVKRIRGRVLNVEAEYDCRGTRKVITFVTNITGAQK